MSDEALAQWVVAWPWSPMTAVRIPVALLFVLDWLWIVVGDRCCLWFFLHFLRGCCGIKGDLRFLATLFLVLLDCFCLGGLFVVRSGTTAFFGSPDRPLFLRDHHWD